MHFTLALLLLTLLLGASGSLTVRAGHGGVDHLFKGHEGLSMGPPAEDSPLSYTLDDALLETVESAAGAGEERLPYTPDVFTSPDHLRTYLSKLNAYYAIAGRPRFGKRSRPARQPATHTLLWRASNQEPGMPALEDYNSQY